MNKNTTIKEGIPQPEYVKPEPPTTFPPLPEHLKGKLMQQTTSSYVPTISTQFVMPPELRFGECWYVKLPGATALVEVEIIEVTKQTVLLKQNKEQSYLTSKLRYKKSDIEFVEKVEEKL